MELSGAGCQQRWCYTSYVLFDIAVFNTRNTEGSMKESYQKAEESVFTPEILVNAVSSVEGFSLSPDGTTVAFTWASRDVTQVYLTPLNKFEPVKLISGNVNSNSPCWSPDGKTIACLRNTDGRDSYDLYAVSVTDGVIRRLTSFKEGSFRGLAWSPDGHCIAFSSNCEGSFDIYTVQADGMNLYRLTSSPESNTAPSWAPDGNCLLCTSSARGTAPRSRIRVISKDGVELSRLGPKGAWNGGACWSPDGTRIAVSSNVVGVSSIGIVDVETGDVSWKTREEAAYLKAWSPNGKLLACMVDRGGNHQTAVVSVDSGSFRTVGPVNGLCSCHEFTPDSSGIVFIREGSGNPSDIWHLNLSSGELRLVTDSLPGTVDRRKLAAPEIISYPSFDNLEIHAFLFKPDIVDPNALPPAIVWVHGGPNYQFMNNWNPTIQLLVNQGYTVLAPNYRGSIGYGKEFTQASINDWGGGDLKDIIAAADYLEESRLADGSRIGLWGGSYGGYLTLLALSSVPERWAAGVDFFGFTDLKTLHEEARGWFREWIEAQIGTPDENAGFYRERSPVTHCADIAAPLLVFQGARDNRVPLSQSKRFVSVLKSHNKVCQLKVYKDEGHGFRKTNNQIDSMNTALTFLNKHL